MTEIKAKFSEDPEIVEIQKGLIYSMSYEGALGILAMLSGIDEFRLREIAVGNVTPHAGEIITLKIHMEI